MAHDFYSLLEVPVDASQEQIKTAFREKVQEYHPDHNDDPRANAQFTAVKKAYDTLGDPVERNAYDRMGHTDYVAKRLSGLPSPDKWAPAEAGGDRAPSAGSGTTGRSTSSGSTGSGSAEGTAGRSGSAGTSSSSGRTSTASTGTGSSRRTGSSAGSGGSRSGSTGSATGTAGSTGSTDSGKRTASDGAGATASGRSVAYADDPIVDFVARHNWARRAVGWPLLYLLMFLYAAGLATVASVHAEAVGDLVDRVAAAGTNTDALAAALERESVPVFYDATIGEFAASTTPETTVVAGTALLALGAVLLPTVVFLLVYLTRLSAGWKPTYLYAVAVLGPLVGLAAGAAVAPPLAADLALFLILPFGALLVMVLSAFVRPKVKAALFG